MGYCKFATHPKPGDDLKGGSPLEWRIYCFWDNAQLCIFLVDACFFFLFGSSDSLSSVSAISTDHCDRVFSIYLWEVNSARYYRNPGFDLQRSTYGVDFSRLEAIYITPASWSNKETCVQLESWLDQPMDRVPLLVVQRPVAGDHGRDVPRT
ncbi:hypothetical protein BJY00DRAFT_278329 [Aspergillus carlsbadensis]|nr:hypothetical protein BJY00DRAFT_278329 [Aspergillus carlsbadensis]